MINSTLSERPLDPFVTLGLTWTLSPVRCTHIWSHFLHTCSFPLLVKEETWSVRGRGLGVTPELQSLPSHPTLLPGELIHVTTNKRTVVKEKNTEILDGSCKV